MTMGGLVQTMMLGCAFAEIILGVETLKAKSQSGGSRRGIPSIVWMFIKTLAGVVGVEPTIHATKKRCLTTWLHPKIV